MNTFLANSGRRLWLPFAIWTAFIVLDLAKSWHFSPQLLADPVRAAKQVAQLFVIYYAWFIFTLWIGLAVEREWDAREPRTVNWLGQLLIAVAFALLHLLIIVLSFWLFGPQRNGFNVPLVFMEMFYKWFLLEVIVYFAVRWYWEQVLRRDSFAMPKPDELVIKTLDGHLRCAPADIACLTADRNYVVLRSNGDTHKVRGTLTAMHDILGTQFFRAHRSALVNLDSIRQVLDQRVVLHDGTRLPLSRSKRSQLMQRIENSHD